MPPGNEDSHTQESRAREDTRKLHQTVWPSGLRRWLQAPVRKGVGSNPTAVTFDWASRLTARLRRLLAVQSWMAQQGCKLRSHRN